MFSAFLNRFKCRYNACFRDIAFIYFTAVPNRFKYNQISCFRDNIFKINSLHFQIVSNTVRTHALETLFSKCSLQFQIVLNSVRMHALEKLFAIFSLQFQMVSNTIRMHASTTLFPKLSMQFQIPSECVLLRHCFQKCLCSFKYRQNECFSDIVFKMFYAVPSCQNKWKYKGLYVINIS